MSFLFRMKILENRIYHLTRDFLGEMGYQRYEISNYAKPGKECRHNIGYWTEVSYLGLGWGHLLIWTAAAFPMKRI